jgi:hypothetical protein
VGLASGEQIARAACKALKNKLCARKLEADALVACLEDANRGQELPLVRFSLRAHWQVVHVGFRMQVHLLHCTLLVALIHAYWP